MRLSLRFLVPLLLALSLFAWAAVPLSDALMTRWFVRDLEIRSTLIAATIQAQLDDLPDGGRMRGSSRSSTSSSTTSVCMQWGYVAHRTWLRR